MRDFLQGFWFDNPVKNYFIVLAIILFVSIFKRYISRSLAMLLFQFVNRVWKHLDKSTFISLVVKPMGMFLLILVAIVALHKLKFPSDLNGELYGASIKNIFASIGRIILIVAFVRLLLRVIDFIAYILEQRANQTPSQTDNQLVVFFRDFFKVVIAIIGVLMVLKFAFHFDISSLLTGLSIVGAAVALALRESLENLIASFIIFFDRPFSQGDLVKVQNITGNVEKIGLRSTRIRTDQKTFVTVPNKQMVDSVLDNLTLRTQLKGEMRLQVSLSASSDQLQQLLEGVRKILEHKEIENSTVVMNDIAPNAFLVNADYFTGPLTYQEFIRVKEDLNLEVLRLFEKLKIEMAGASTGVRIEGPVNMQAVNG